MAKNNYKRDDNIENKEKVKSLIKLIKKCKAVDRFKTRSELLRKEIKSTNLWKIVNKEVKDTNMTPNIIIHNNVPYKSPKDQANILNSEYINRVTSLRSTIPVNNLDPLKYFRKLIPKPKQLLDFKETIFYQMQQIFKLIKPTRSAGTDTIPFIIIKEQQKLLIHVITNIYNGIIKKKIYPDIMKIHRIVPVFKKGEDPTQPKSWRPINILQALAKPIERLIATQIIKHLEDNNLIPPQHYGSQTKLTTNDAIENFNQRLIMNRAFKLPSISIQTDASAAFDCCSHPTLIRKLAHLGLTLDSLEIMENFLKERVQCTTINGH